MIRCHNVNALRTSVGNALAIRAAHRPITVAFNSRSNAPSLCPFVARQSQLLPRTGFGTPLGPVKAYSTDHTPDTDSTQPQPDDNRPAQHDDSLFALAMGSQSHTALISRGVIERELIWLQDPKALSDRVRKLLPTHRKVSDRKVALAVALVRTAQTRGMECMVAWNSLLSYCMDKKSPRSAFKFYNDMKKRGRRPNDYTYTIMLNGLSKAQKESGFRPMDVALSIYRSIDSNPDVERNIIHSNVMLTVCARHGAMDTLWQIASELPDNGPGSPEPMTYSIILQALGNTTVRDAAKMRQKHATARRAQGVTEAKRVWTDVIYRWKNGDLSLDSQLLEVMAKVLLEGPGQYSIYEVFVMLHQTTGLPILAKEPRKDPVTESVGRAPRKGKDLEHVPFVDEGERLYRPQEPDAETPEEAEAEEEENLDEVFKPVVSKDQSSGPTLVSLTNRELYRVLEACSSMTQGLGTAQAYWKLITTEFGVEPDARSFNSYLQILQAARASRAAVELVRDKILPSGQAETEMFVAALKSCRRDINNMNVLNHANELLKLMHETFPLPNLTVLDVYFSLVDSLLEKPQLLMSLDGVAGPDRSRSLETFGHTLRLKLRTVALDNLRPHVDKLEEALAEGETEEVQGRAKSAKRRGIHVLGSEAVSTLARVRHWMNPVLDPENRSIPYPALQEYQKLSHRLRKYSNKRHLKQFTDKFVYPPGQAQVESDGWANDCEENWPEVDEEI